MILWTAPAGAATFTVTNTNASGTGSLHDAIVAANQTTDADTIEFALKGSGVKRITGTLPPITQPLTIDGYSQVGSSPNTVFSGSNNAVILVEIAPVVALPRGAAVLKIDAGSTTIRGVAIGGIPTSGSGIEIGPEVRAIIRGCFIGTDASGSSDQSAGTGILNRGDASIGGTILPTDYNLISGNSAAGIHQVGPTASIFGNFIGTNAAGAPSLPNGDGIVVDGPDVATVQIGPPHGDRAPNVIAGNSGRGIVVRSDVAGRTMIEGNSIHDNDDLGIDLNADGVTPNDVDDVDSGPNGMQNSFEDHLARFNVERLHFEGYINSPAGSYFVEAFSNQQADPSGFGEGEKFVRLGRVDVADGTSFGFLRFSVRLPSASAAPLFVTTTAKSLEGTSEFSRAASVVDGGTEFVVTTTDDDGPGSLRAAVDAANANPDVSTVSFDILGDGPHTIHLLSEVALNSPIILDGYSQPLAHPNTLRERSNADVRVVIDGANATTDESGITINNPDCIVRGLGIGNFGINGLTVASGGDRAQIEGNFIGTDATGLLDEGNVGDGIEIAAGATDVEIGGNQPHQRNLISGNDGNGIEDHGTHTLILNNFIGGKADGKGGFGNASSGIVAAGTSTLIGDDDGDSVNLVRSNAVHGVAIVGDASGVRVRGNRMLANGGLGIDLAPDGEAGIVTANDADDVDDGPNGLQNSPVIVSLAVDAAGLNVAGSLDVPATATDATYSIGVYQSRVCDPSGHGEGAEFLGAADVVLSADAEGFSFGLPFDASEGNTITLTATDVSLANTSEFSECLDLPGGESACGDASGDGNIAASDALLELQVAIGTAQCELCVCDANGSGDVTASDALLILQSAVGQSVTLDCPACS